MRLPLFGASVCVCAAGITYEGHDRRILTQRRCGLFVLFAVGTDSQLQKPNAQPEGRNLKLRSWLAVKAETRERLRAAPGSSIVGDGGVACAPLARGRLPCLIAEHPHTRRQHPSPTAVRPAQGRDHHHHHAFLYGTARLTGAVVPPSSTGSAGHDAVGVVRGVLDDLLLSAVADRRAGTPRVLEALRPRAAPPQPRLNTPALSQEQLRAWTRRSHQGAALATRPIDNHSVLNVFVFSGMIGGVYFFRNFIPKLSRCIND